MTGTLFPLLSQDSVASSVKQTDEFPQTLMSSSDVAIFFKLHLVRDHFEPKSPKCDPKNEQVFKKTCHTAEIGEKDLTLQS